MSQYSIAVLIGSLRAESVNRKLANAVLKLAVNTCIFNILEIGNLPLYNQDNDGKDPEVVQKFKSAIKNATGVLFFTPEYNRSIPGVLKNAIDHGSRPYGQSVWTGKPAGVMGASIGTLGSALAQQHLRNVLAYLDMPTLGQPEAFIHVKEGLFDAAGNLTNPDTQKFLQNWIDKYLVWVKKIAG